MMLTFLSDFVLVNWLRLWLQFVRHSVHGGRTVSQLVQDHENDYGRSGGVLRDGRLDVPGPRVRQRGWARLGRRGLGGGRVQSERRRRLGRRVGERVLGGQLVRLVRGQRLGQRRRRRWRRRRVGRIGKELVRSGARGRRGRPRERQVPGRVHVEPRRTGRLVQVATTSFQQPQIDLFEPWPQIVVQRYAPFQL